MKKSILLILLSCLLAIGIAAESGDMNNDGKETLLDVISILKQAQAAKPLATADMDGDGTINVQDALFVLRRVLNLPVLPAMTDVSKDMQFMVRNCSWSYNDGVLTLNSVSQGGDGFAMSGIYVPGGTAFAFEATMQVTKGNKCGGLTFGVRAPERPEVMWYCVNVDHTGKRTRLFSVGTGTVGTTSAAPRRALTEEELAMDTYTVRIEVTEGGKISWWMNGEFVASAMEENFAGGYLGFNAFKSCVVFSDISVRIGESALPAAESITAVNGNWNFAGGTLTGTNSSVGDRFAMTDVFVPAGKAFSVETTATLLGGSNTGGIVFGVSNPKSPASAWYCANVSKKSARLFSVKTGSLGTGSGTTVALPAAENYKTDFRLRLTGSADGTIAYYVDDVLAFERQDTTFAGGYIGFNTYKSYVSFKDIVITVDGKVQQLSNALLTASDTQIALQADAAYQSVFVPATANEVTVKLPIPEGYTARVGTELVENGTYTFAPAYGKNKVQIDLRDKYARKTTMVLEVMRDIPADLLYSDTYRPRLHVTPPKNFMNDPNGLHYNASTGEYHAYYQWNPTQMRMGNQVWGHAASKDLLHWTDHGIAIDRPADGDAIFSGCAVIDRDNTSGLFDESVAPDNRVVAIYTITGPFRQELAYSTDGGYTFTKYAGNPVIASSNYFASFRDPKIQWIEEKQLWLLVIAGGPMELYTSPDLIHWTSQGTMKYLNGTTIESECPMLLALPLDGDENNIKYVYVGSGRFYVVGDLVWDGDSVEFVAEQTKTATVFYSSPHYASQNFYNDAYGRTLVMNWMQDLVSGSLLDEKYWNGVQSLPYETTLVTENGRMALHFTPIAELEKAKGDTLCSITDVTLTDNALDTEAVSAVYGILDMKAKLSEGATLTLGLREGEGYQTTFTFAYGTANSVTVTMNTKTSGPIARTTKTATVTTDANGYFSIKTVLDNIALETFTSDGKVFADTIFPPVTADGISLTATGTAHIAEFTVYAIK